MRRLVSDNLSNVMYHYSEMLMYTPKRNKEMAQGRTNTKVVLVTGILLMIIALVLQPLSFQPLNAQSASSTSVSSLNQNNSTNLTSEMKRIENSKDPKDIATLAYIWGYPLVSMIRLIDYASNPARSTF